MQRRRFIGIAALFASVRPGCVSGNGNTTDDAENDRSADPNTENLSATVENIRGPDERGMVESKQEVNTEINCNTNAIELHGWIDSTSCHGLKARALQPEKENDSIKAIITPYKKITFGTCPGATYEYTVLLKTSGEVPEKLVVEYDHPIESAREKIEINIKDC